MQDLSLVFDCEASKTEILAECEQHYEKDGFRVVDSSCAGVNAASGRSKLEVEFLYEPGRCYLPRGHLQPPWRPPGQERKTLQARELRWRKRTWSALSRRRAARQTAKSVGQRAFP